MCLATAFVVALCNRFVNDIVSEMQPTARQSTLSSWPPLDNGGLHFLTLTFARAGRVCLARGHLRQNEQLAYLFR